VVAEYRRRGRVVSHSRIQLPNQATEFGPSSIGAGKIPALTSRFSCGTLFRTSSESSRQPRMIRSPDDWGSEGVLPCLAILEIPKLGHIRLGRSRDTTAVVSPLRDGG
jgi:hypothetical protein